MSMTETAARTSTIPCWRCGAAAGVSHFCPSCGKIQPLPRAADYFAFFDLPRKLQLDVADLERRFHRLSWKLHPDNFVKTSDYERSLSLERSSQLNDAFRSLREPIPRVEYLLALLGMRKEGTTKQQAPPELLEEVFELNESLDELRQARASGANLGELRRKLAEAQRNFQANLADLDRDLETVFAQWDSIPVASNSPDNSANRPAESARQQTIARLNDILNRRSYLRNLVQNVQKELAEA